jgi:hypothetical protein
MNAKQRRFPARTEFESLEDRRLFVAYGWVAPAGGLWGVPANWAPIGVPGAFDTATIALPGIYTVTVGGALTLTALTVGDGGAGGPGQQKLVLGGNLNVAMGTTAVANGRIEMAPAGTNVIKTGALALFGDGTLDLNDNDAIVGAATAKAVIEGYVKTARNGGSWNMAGLTSTTAKINPQHTTGLGVLGGADYISVRGPMFDGNAVAAGDTVLKYTYSGDGDFNGRVDGDDYARIDTTYNDEAFMGPIGGWFHGDSDFNGKVDGADYALIDAAFVQQTVTLRPGSPFSSPDDHESILAEIDALSTPAESN